MKYFIFGTLLSAGFLLFTSTDISAQSWEFIKEKDGIKIYTRKEANNSIKSFKGEAYLHAKFEKVAAVIGNVKNFDWWDDDITEIKILLNEPDKRVQYYLVYDTPWPVSDRDLVVDSRITTDPKTGIKMVEAKSLLNVVPEKSDKVRIKKYWQRWTIIPMDNGVVHVILEGSVDPGGSVPAWLYNMVITETPLKVIRSVQTHVAQM